VTVLEVDLARNRISLSMRQNPEASAEATPGVREPKTKPSNTRPPQKTHSQQKARPQQKREAPVNNSAFADALKKAGLK
jgi:uncharacterized protein